MTVRQHTAKLSRETIVRYWSGSDGPSWRWRAARTGLKHPFALRDDPDIVAASRYLKLRARHPAQAAREYPGVAAADQLQQCENTSELLQLLFLANFSVPEAARHTQLSESHITLWQRLFFDIDDGRDAPSWINLHVIRPMRGIKPLVAVKMRLAYYGGRAVLEEILNSEDAYSKDEATQLRWIRVRYGLELEACLEQLEARRERSPHLVTALMKGWLAAQRPATKRRKPQQQSTELDLKSNIATFLAGNQQLINNLDRSTPDMHLPHEDDATESPRAAGDPERAA